MSAAVKNIIRAQNKIVMNTVNLIEKGNRKESYIALQLIAHIHSLINSSEELTPNQSTLASLLNNSMKSSAVIQEFFGNDVENMLRYVSDIDVIEMDDNLGHDNIPTLTNPFKFQIGML